MESSSGPERLAAVLKELIPESDSGKDRDEAGEEEDEAEEVQEALLVDELVKIVSTTGVPQLVEVLGPQLTSEDPIPRVKATAVLCEVIRKLEDESRQLGAVQVKTMVNFFLSRYETDWESSLACLRGIQALLKRTSYSRETLFADGFARTLLQSVLTSHTVNELTQSLRSLVFEITKFMMKECGNFMKQTASDPWLTSAFTTAMAGEKDPRCLIVCLDIVAALLKNQDLGGDQYVEDAFELTSVYFPITFRPPPNDPFGITHEGLVESLNSVFCAIPAMASCVIPMALDKIMMTSSEAAPTRLEALKLIARCAKDFDALTLAPYLGDLRDALVGLILSPEENELAVEALSTLKALVRMVAPRAQVNANDALWEELTLVTLRRCGMALEASFDSMAANGAARILTAVSESGTIGFVTTLKGLVPLLEKHLTQNTDLSTPSKTRAAMDLIRSIARCVDPQIGHLPGQGPMDGFAPRLFALVVDQLQKTLNGSTAWLTLAEESRLVVNCCLAMKDLICRPVHLTLDPQVVSQAAKTVCDQVLLATIRSKVRTEKRDVVAAGLVCLVDTNEKCKDLRIVAEMVLPALLKEAADTIDSPHFDYIGGEPKEKFDMILGTFPVLCQTKDSAIAKSIADYVRSLDKLPAKAKMLTLSKIAKTIDAADVVEECFLGTEDAPSYWMGAPENRQLLFILCERCSPEMNQKLARLAVDRMKTNQEVDSGTEACLLGSRRDYDFILPECFELLKAKPDLASDDSFLRVFACALNKCPSSMVQRPEDAQRLYDMTDGLTILQSARLMGRAFKSLTLRSSVLPADKLGKFLQSLLHSEDEQVAMEVAQAFGNLVVVQGLNDGLDVPFARCQGVARQRAFEKWFRTLTEDMSTSQMSGEALLAASVSLAAGAPQPVLMEILREVIPIMVRASRSERLATRVAALRILKTIIDGATDAVESHLNTLIPFLLGFTYGALKSNNPEDRLDALSVLETLPVHLPYHKLHPYKATVSSALAKGALDDPKRVVRQKAVQCREHWATFAAS